MKDLYNKLANILVGSNSVKKKTDPMLEKMLKNKRDRIEGYETDPVSILDEKNSLDDKIDSIEEEEKKRRMEGYKQFLAKEYSGDSK